MCGAAADLCSKSDRSLELIEKRGVGFEIDDTSLDSLARNRQVFAKLARGLAYDLKRRLRESGHTFDGSWPARTAWGPAHANLQVRLIAFRLHGGQRIAEVCTHAHVDALQDSIIVTTVDRATNMSERGHQAHRRLPGKWFR